MDQFKVIYVTGITGFIGSNLLKYLLQKYVKVVNFTRNNSLQIYEKNTMKEINVSSKFLIQNPASIFINLATLYIPNPNSAEELENIVEANILFPSRVYSSLAHTADLKIINALSYHQLLDFNSQNVYSLSKELFKKFLDNQNIEIVSVYIFDTFGSGDTRKKVVDIFIKNILCGNPITIPSNEIKINLADVQIVCRSLMKSIEVRQGSYSLKSPDTITLEELAKMIMEISNKKVDLIKAGSSLYSFDEIKIFPENIFFEDSDYSFQKSLSERIKEIKESM